MVRGKNRSFDKQRMIDERLQLKRRKHAYSQGVWLMRFGKMLAALAALVGASATAQAEVPVEDLARYPAMSRLSMSPDGKFIVGLMVPPGNKGDEQALFYWDLTKKNSSPSLTPGNDRMHFIGAQALESGKILVTTRQAWTGRLAGCGEGKITGATRTFVRKMYLTDTEIKDFDEAFVQAGSSDVGCADVAIRAQIIDSLPLDEDEVIIQRAARSGDYVEYARYNLKTGRSKTVFRDNDDESASIWNSRTGELLTKSRLDETGDGDYNFTTLIVNAEGEFEDHPKLAYNTKDRNVINVVGYDEATGKFYVVTDKFSDKAALYYYDAKTKTFDDQPLFAHPDFDVVDVTLGRRPSRFNQLISVEYDGPDRTSYYVHPEFVAIEQGLQQAFPGKTITLVNWTDDLNTIMFTTASTTETITYYVLKNKTTPQLLGAQRPWILPESVGETKYVTYKARDGMTIPAFLSTPPGWKKEDGPVPTVVMPHGGPWSRDYLQSASGGDNWVHFYTSRGYAVLKPQYRGSEGWGHALWLAGDNEWGQKMQDDKDDGAAWLVAEGVADPDKLVLMGYSYGGFAAFAGSVRENSPYQCAIAGAGVSRLDRIRTNWGEGRVQRANQAHTITGMDPIDNTDKLNIPLLIVHGDRDVRVPLYHSTDFYNKVKDNDKGVPVKMVVVKDMPHSNPWWPEHFNTMFNAIDDFLENECGLQ